MLDVSTDYLIFDNKVDVTLTQRDTSGNPVIVPVTDALRRNIPSTEAAASGGKYTSHDTRFHLSSGQASPVVGDTITDTDGTVYAIMEAWFNTLTSMWKCVSRNLAIAYKIDTKVEVQRGVPVRGSSGEQEKTWETIAIVAASITELSMSEQSESEKSSFADRSYEIILATDTQVSPNHRIMDVSGNYYSIESTTNKDNIRALQSCDCTRLATSDRTQ